ncbi:MAG: ATP-cobalamin adenosyltransferase [Candidatus Nomurabacteria bacterium GW2011_GWA2_43_15]|uniref:Corrinoid adenosyltransferase n=2 Tax=Candidatus Nomuraibacteriota TaxID=1752729 RepID=A0A0G1DU69_9BACT|nr:MAG: ATP-cobalamin adenosyltransferase [Candidatus Nomurabacteria bacterium GW2011_GWA2_43_15]KKT19859.1 MAG: ATP-cobalamin adenosyltransferase [Candidatus Nomurabacteria bacterium GW2011_GWB1_43_7]
MLYTRKGDGGTTKTFGCDQRISKSSVVAEALGALDEANSFLGLARARTVGKSFKIESGRVDFAETILEAQQNLFIIQAEVAGAELSIDQGKVLKVETIVDGIEKILPPIKNFFISGATKDGAVLDITRTLVRRAERRVIAAREEGKIKMSAETLAYLNRLSSLLYALARLASHLEGAEEIKPDYK